jgi:hypothetical protein
MRLIVGAPVANRAWSLPRWFECLAGQTRRPDGFVFIHSGIVHDATWIACQTEAARHDFSPVALQHDPTPPHARHDNERFRTLANVRNALLRVARDELDAELFLSLDTDIMLEDPETIERLEALVHAKGPFGYDVASPLVFLHPQAPRTWSPAELPCWAYNFGWLADHGPAQQTLVRPPVAEIPWGNRIAHQVPMAAWLGNRKAMECRYDWHLSGEDVGFGLALREAAVACTVDTSLYARNIWCDTDLKQQELEDALPV